jgi:hypothetical protein
MEVGKIRASWTENGLGEVQSLISDPALLKDLELRHSEKDSRDQARICLTNFLKPQKLCSITTDRQKRGQLNVFADTAYYYWYPALAEEEQRCLTGPGIKTSELFV